MLNNQQPLQAMRGAQVSATNQASTAYKPDDGQPSFESKLSEQLDSSEDDKKALNPPDNPNASEATPASTQSTALTAQPKTTPRESADQRSENNRIQASTKDKDTVATEPSLKDGLPQIAASLTSRQYTESFRLARNRSDSARISLGENDLEKKSLKLSSPESTDSKQIPGVSGLSVSSLSSLAASSTAGVSTVHLTLSSAGPEASAKNLPSAADVQLATSFGDPHFESSFASQISFLTSQGITHAKIHLNPQEMGPVSVDIHSVGDKVEVSFQAAREQTRQAIEASIETLRGLMRDEGMSLQNAVVRNIEVTSPQAMSASSEQRSSDFQFDRSNQFEGFEKGFQQNSRDRRPLDDQTSGDRARADLGAAEPSVGRNVGLIPSRRTGIDLFA